MMQRLTILPTRLPCCSRMYLLILQAVVLFLSQPWTSRAIILCDGDCLDNLNLEICRPFNDSRKPIYVMAFLPCNTETFRARGFTVAAQMAIRAVHNHSSILQDYSLRLAFNNTKVNTLAMIIMEFVHEYI